jgi:hypothetical protein
MSSTGSADASSSHDGAVNSDASRPPHAATACSCLLPATARSHEYNAASPQLQLLQQQPAVATAARCEQQFMHGCMPQQPAVLLLLLLLLAAAAKF